MLKKISRTSTKQEMLRQKSKFVYHINKTKLITDLLSTDGAAVSSRSFSISSLFIIIWIVIAFPASVAYHKDKINVCHTAINSKHYNSEITNSSFRSHVHDLHFKKIK